MLVVLLIGSVLASCAPVARARISEVLYDAAGTDTGYEFVELFNSTSAPVALAGVRLEAGDGAGPGRWTTKWTGSARDTIGAGARFVIGGAFVAPAPDAVVTLDLQNGPDAVRLVWPDGATEVVGYGALSDSEYFCGAPAGDVAAGQSLARLPDDADRGSNALDFSAAEPSPGRANQVMRDAAIRPRSLALDPGQPAPQAPARLSATVQNRGAAPLAGATLEAFDPGGAIGSAAAPPLAPGDSARVTCELAGLPAGRQVLVARVALPGDERASNDADSLVVRVGPGPLRVTEIQFHPAAGEGEWVEVQARDPAGVTLSDFTLGDSGERAAALPAGAPWLASDSLALLAEDRAALLIHYPSLDPLRVIEVSPWAALNNSDGPDGVADAVVLRERDGTPCDRVTYSAHGVPAGVPIELGPAGWGVDSDPGGTPLAPPSGGPAAHARFRIGPERVRAGEIPRLAWELPWPRARLAIDVFDLAGRRVTRFAEAIVGARGVRPIENLPGPGVYLVAIAARSEDGAEVRETRALRLAGRGP